MSLAGGGGGVSLNGTSLLLRLDGNGCTVLASKLLHETFKACVLVQKVNIKAEDPGDAVDVATAGVVAAEAVAAECLHQLKQRFSSTSRGLWRIEGSTQERHCL